jgi:hypothetical protein
MAAAHWLPAFAGTTAAGGCGLISDGGKLHVSGTAKHRPVPHCSAPEVAVSIDGGKTWIPVKLGRDLGKYSFREWTLALTLAAGASDIKVSATSNGGDTQPMEPRWNPAGYPRNVVETVRVTAA